MNTAKDTLILQKTDGRLVYYEAYYLEADARERERQIKRRSKAYVSLKRRLKTSIEVLLQDYKEQNQPTLSHGGL